MATKGTRHHVIIGASAAGLAALEAIRSVDRASKVTVLSKEPAPLYSRVGLTHFLDGTVTRAGMNTHGAEYFARLDARLLDGVAALHVDPDRRKVRLSTGRTLAYDTLLVASGSSAAIPPLKGTRLRGVHACITRADAIAIDRGLARARRVVVVGAGLIGIQAADAIAKRGRRVAIVEQMPYVMASMVDPQAARLFEQLLRDQGHIVHTGARVVEIAGEARRVAGVRLEGGEVVPCDLCILAAGVRPNLEFLEGTPVQRRQGLLVDASQRTSLPSVYAAGDAAETTDMFSGQRVLMAIWPEALSQGRVAGLNMAGVPTTYAGSMAMNTTSVLGLPIASLGLWHVTDSAEYAIHSRLREAQRAYRKLVFAGRNLVGAILVGDAVNAEAGILHNVIRTRQSLSMTPEQLVAGPVSWGRLLYGNRAAGRLAPPAGRHTGREERPSAGRPLEAGHAR
jgi:NAD(P)H-nitrite reductase large subunit